MLASSASQDKNQLFLAIMLRMTEGLGSRVCGDEGFFASPFEALRGSGEPQGKLRVTEGLDSRMHRKEKFEIGLGVLSGGWVPACAGMAEGSRLRVVTPR